MTGRPEPFCLVIVAALAVLGVPAPAWSACPAGLPAEPAFHLPIEKLAPVASQLADHMAKKNIQGRAPNGVETRRLADVQLDPKVNYGFRIYTPLSAIPAGVQNAFVAAGELPTHAEIESVKRRQLARLDIEMLLFMGEAAANRRPEGLVPPSVLQTLRYFIHEFLTPEDNDTFFKRDMRRRGNEQIIGYFIIKSNKVTYGQLLELTLNLNYFGQGSYGITAASMNYFGKPVDRLSLAEASYLAILLKGPVNYHPVRQADKAIERRNWAIDQMRAKGFITEANAKSAKAEPLGVKVITDRAAR
jgi:penicillin-binding protein 1A